MKAWFIFLALLVSSTASAELQSWFEIARFGFVDEVQNALALGNDPNTRDAFGQTPLMFAASGNQDPTIYNLLVAAGADVNAQSQSGWTALMFAARDNPNSAVVARLLTLGANPNLRNSQGLRALDYAQNNGFLNANQDGVLTRLRNATIDATVQAAMPTMSHMPTHAPVASHVPVASHIPSHAPVVSHAPATIGTGLTLLERTRISSAVQPLQSSPNLQARSFPPRQFAPTFAPRFSNNPNRLFHNPTSFTRNSAPGIITYNQFQQPFFPY